MNTVVLRSSGHIDRRRYREWVNIGRAFLAVAAERVRQPGPAPAFSWQAGRQRCSVDNWFLGLVLLLGDLGLLGGLVVAVVVAARRLGTSGPARAGSDAHRRWAALIGAVAALGLVVVGNTWFMIFSFEDGRPSLAQVTGTWTDRDVGGTATLRIYPDGSFTATGLPPDVSSSGTRDVTVRTPGLRARNMADDS